MSQNPRLDIADVVIVGLGPTGLVLAHMLGRGGHRVVVFEREPVFYGNARAVYTDDECLRVFQYLGLAEALQKQMVPDTPVQFVRPDGSPLGQYMPLKRTYGWPVINFFYQPYLETTLSSALSRYPNVEVRRGREVIEFTQDADGVDVVHQATREARFSDSCDARIRLHGEAVTQTIRARYMIGADGGRSIVRTMLGIAMTGKSFPEPWLVVDLWRKPGVDALRHLPYFNFVVNPKLPVVSCTQPDGFHRFEFMLMPGETKEHMEKPETVRHYLSMFVDPDQFEIKRKLVYTFNALIAGKWREGRVFLAGDAAHMTPQFMGQGASSGIRDACNLGWKLDLVLKGLAEDSLLDSYQKERHGHAKAMIDVSVLLKNVVSTTNPFATVSRDLTFAAMRGISPLRRWLQEGGFKPRPVYAKGAYVGLPRRRFNGPEGTLAPQPEVRCFNGARVLLDELLGGGFSLVGFNVDPRDGLDAESRETLQILGAKLVTLFGYGGRPQGLRNVARDAAPGAVEVEDINGLMPRWFSRAGYRTTGVAILRPDRFAFAVVSVAELNRAIAELRRQLGMQAGLSQRAPKDTRAESSIGQAA